MLNREFTDDTMLFYDGAREVLAIQEAEADGNIILTVKGALGSEAVHDFQDELIALATVGANIIVDLSGLTYLASSAQHALLQVQQKMDAMGKGTLTLVKTPENIYREFERTGVSELLMFDE